MLYLISETLPRGGYLLPWKKIGIFPCSPKSKSWFSIFPVPQKCICSLFPSVLDFGSLVPLKKWLYALVPQNPWENLISETSLHITKNCVLYGFLHATSRLRDHLSMRFYMYKHSAILKLTRSIQMYVVSYMWLHIHLKSHVIIKCATKKKLFGLSVESIFQCACPTFCGGHMSCSLAEVSLWPTAYVSEQHRLWRDCADAQARLNLSCSLFATTNIFPWRCSNVLYFQRTKLFCMHIVPIFVSRLCCRRATNAFIRHSE